MPKPQVELRVADEPTTAGIAYDVWRIHPETFGTVRYMQFGGDYQKLHCNLYEHMYR